MEHIIVKQLKNGYKKITPEDGYILYNKKDRKYYSEAVVKKTTEYIAVSIDETDI